MLSEKEKDYYKHYSKMELFERLKMLMLKYPLMQVKPEDFADQYRAFDTVLSIFITEYNTINAGLVPDYMKDETLQKEADEWERLL